MKRIVYLTVLWLLPVFTSVCQVKKGNENMKSFVKGTYGYDLNFLGKYKKPIELKEGESRVLLLAEYQGRVMTSTSGGENGLSYGWINHDLIGSEKILPHINAVGGEERFWMGPEGGQYSIFFPKGKSFDFANWQTPLCIDTEPFNLTGKTDKKADFTREISLENYGGFRFDLKVERSIEIADKKEIMSDLGIEIPDGVGYVGFESSNRLINTGKTAWTKQNGLLSIWLLGMYNPSPDVTVVLPYNKDARTDYIVKDDYFGKVPSDRLKIKDGYIFFKCDGKYRSKIGVPPGRAKSCIGSYDGRNNILTIVRYSIPEGVVDYVNSAWEIQKFPFKGDVVNSYNDGPLQDGSQMGPFYELETSSPGAALKPGESIVHKQQTFHFQGDKKLLNPICRKVLGLTIDEISN